MVAQITHVFWKVSMFSKKLVWYHLTFLQISLMSGLLGDNWIRMFAFVFILVQCALSVGELMSGEVVGKDKASQNPWKSLKTGRVLYRPSEYPAFTVNQSPSFSCNFGGQAAYLALTCNLGKLIDFLSFISEMGTIIITPNLFVNTE